MCARLFATTPTVWPPSRAEADHDVRCPRRLELLEGEAVVIVVEEPGDQRPHVVGPPRGGGQQRPQVLGRGRRVRVRLPRDGEQGGHPAGTHAGVLPGAGHDVRHPRLAVMGLRFA
ncbi:hypothetical protein LUX33_50510 [Actinomadura madurae]|nr:hypothetical protein [Actinomadura madurae]